MSNTQWYVHIYDEFQELMNHYYMSEKYNYKTTLIKFMKEKIRYHYLDERMEVQYTEEVVTKFIEKAKLFMNIDLGK